MALAFLRGRAASPKSEDLIGGPVPDPHRNVPVDYATLAEFLDALAYPLRLQLLDGLRFPHSLSEIRLSPHRREGGRTTDRPAARQTIQQHLDKLVDADLVQVAQPGGGRVPTYTVNAAKLYELTEQLRLLSVRYAGRGAGPDATGTMAFASPAREPTGPRLVLVHGVYEGKSFALDSEAAPDERWTIGRRAGVSVSLDYDPFVSLEHAVVSRDRGHHVLADLGSKNGTSVNWNPLPRAGSRVLRTGDIVGAGRSLLSFVAE